MDPPGPRAIQKRHWEAWRICSERVRTGSCAVLRPIQRSRRCKKICQMARLVLRSGTHEVERRNRARPVVLRKDARTAGWRTAAVTTTAVTLADWMAKRFGVRIGKGAAQFLDTPAFACRDRAKINAMAAHDRRAVENWLVAPDGSRCVRICQRDEQVQGARGQEMATAKSKGRLEALDPQRSRAPGRGRDEAASGPPPMETRYGSATISSWFPVFAEDRRPSTARGIAKVLSALHAPDGGLKNA